MYIAVPCGEVGTYLATRYGAGVPFHAPSFGVLDDSHGEKILVWG